MLMVMVLVLVVRMLLLWWWLVVVLLVVSFGAVDDWQDPQMFEKMMGRANATGADVIFCNAKEFNELNGQSSQLYQFPKELLVSPIYDLSSWESKEKLINRYFPPWTKLVKRELLESYTIRFSEDGNKFDDVLYHYSTILSAKSASFIDEVLYTHRFFKGSISQNLNANTDLYFDDFKTWSDIESFCSTHAFDLKKVFMCFMYEMAFHCFEVKSQKEYLKKFQALIHRLGIKPEDLPSKKLRKSYKRVMDFSPLKETFHKLRRQAIRFRFKPKKKEYMLSLFGFRLF